MRYFTEQDWYGLCGAESETEGLYRKPMIGTKENPLDITVVVDKNGVELIGWLEDAEECDDYAFVFECTYDMALLIALVLEERLAFVESFENLEAMLVKELGFAKIL